MKFRLIKDFNYDTLYKLQIRKLFYWKQICLVFGKDYKTVKAKADKIIEEYIKNHDVWEVK